MKSQNRGFFKKPRRSSKGASALGGEKLQGGASAAGGETSAAGGKPSVGIW
ncbi:MAG: hypothetical protein PUP93_17385 [Rhizonema sp. NSF051]|nr:hypothetical protein [Rhizonema sp. NSF051]